MFVIAGASIVSVRAHAQPHSLKLLKKLFPPLPPAPQGWTALVYAAKNGHGDIVTVLIDHGANTESEDKDVR